MPTIARIDRYRLFIYSDEGNPREPPHIHVMNGDKVAKVWLAPVALAHSKRFKSGEISHIITIVRDNEATLREAWDAYFRP